MVREDAARTLPVERAGRGSESYVRELSPGAQVSLLVFHLDGARVATLVPGQPVVVGRAAPSDITIDDANLSREHARFTLRSDGLVLVEDLASTNGTLVDGVVVEQAELRPGQEVTLGASTATILAAEGSQPFSVSASAFTGHERFRSVLETELVRARFLSRPLAVLSVRAEGTSGTHVRSWAMRLQALLRPIDRVGLYSDDSVHVLLPEAGTKQASEVASTIVRSLAAAKDRPCRVVCGVAVFPDGASSIEELLGESRAAARQSTTASPVTVAQEGGPRTIRGAENRVGLVVESQAMRQLLETANRVAKGNLPVLLHGETGTGKEVLSRYIHLESGRRESPLVCVNCAAIPQQLVESTLFGHERGAFTGANVQQKGVFEAADGGTVFLDEIGELAPPAQAALLRVLETKRFARVGATKEIAVDVRVIAATHRDLEGMVEEGRFRQDLLFRLNAITLAIPKLRDRPEDIPLLAQRFLEDANAAHGGALRGFDGASLELLAAYPWPGNVRELKNAIERAVVIAQGDLITIDDLPERVRVLSRPPTASFGSAAGSPEASLLDAALGTLQGDFRSRMEQLEARLLTLALEDARWNQTEAARRLSMALRTMVYKIRTHGIRRPAGGKAR